MFVLRPARLADLAGIEALAQASPAGVTSLPADRETLYRKVQSSVDSLAAEVSFHGEESYFFVMEAMDGGELVGVSGIVASAGFNEPFYSYRNEAFVHASPGLNIHNRIHALSLCHDLTGNSLLSSFYLREGLHFTRWSDLLSRARLLFIAQWPERFAEAVVSEMIGVTDPQGNSAFWDAVGRVFFGIDYQEAELHCGIKGRKFIAELMPQHPLYVPLLSDAAQEVMGQVGEHARVPYDILTREGFETENYIDIFDGGPTLYASTRGIRTVAQSQLATVASGKAGPHAFLVATTRQHDFRATVAEAEHCDGHIVLSTEILNALALAPGDTVRIAPL
ncbi:arginine N-succinyltransferase [Chitinimonas naiadis]